MTTTAPANLTDVLILSTFYTTTLPVLTDSNGKKEELNKFMFDSNTEVLRSCSLTWRGEHYVFGGEKFRRQISKIEKCELKRFGELTFNFRQGACSNVADQFIYLCFNITGMKKCRKLTRPDGESTEIGLANHFHAMTQIASSSSKIQIYFWS